MGRTAGSFHPLQGDLNQASAILLEGALAAGVVRIALLVLEAGPACRDDALGVSSVGKAAGIVRDRSSWDFRLALVRRACLHARRTPVLYSRNQPRTNRAL